MVYLKVVLVLVCCYGLWCHVVDGATADVSLDARLLRLDAVGYPKVDELQPCSDADKVLRLQVVVDDPLVVDHLGEGQPRLETCGSAHSQLGGYILTSYPGLLPRLYLAAVEKSPDFSPRLRDKVWAEGLGTRLAIYHASVDVNRVPDTP